MIVQAVLLPMPSATSEVRVFWVVLLGWLVAFGAGGFSGDRLLRPGSASSALPGAAAALRFGNALSSRGVPRYLAALRLFLCVEIGASFLDLPRWIATIPVPLAQSAGSAFTNSFVLVGLVFLALGLLTPFAGLLLIALIPASAAAMVGDHRVYWLLVLSIPVVCGPGCLAVDGWLERIRAAARPQAPPILPHVVVVGAGFGGIAVARGLRHARCTVTLLDRRNHHLFQPLLYQVATAGLSPADIATPIRSLFRTQTNVKVLVGEATGIDAARQSVSVGSARIDYDFLVIATGARHAYFGHDEWAPHAPGLKSIEDATDIRRRILTAFENAESTDDLEARTAWLTFVIVGGGPTGVELAGAIAELARHGLKDEFRSIDPANARVVLVQSGSRLLPTFAPPLSASAERALRSLGVEIVLDQRVENIDGEGVVVGGRRLAARTVIWAAGVKASPAAKWLGIPADNLGRVIVGDHLDVAGHDGIFAIGDTASSNAWNGANVPGLAPAAKQGGQYVAAVIKARLKGGSAPRPFRYRHFGSLATIGRRAAVVDLGRVRISGALAWWLWGAAHVTFLVGGRNRVSVIVEWMWAYVTFRRGTRLITGVD
jgi:NADH dehydrogenase/putative oxidoreductase